MDKVAIQVAKKICLRGDHRVEAAPLPHFKGRPVGGIQAAIPVEIGYKAGVNKQVIDVGATEADRGGANRIGSGRQI